MKIYHLSRKIFLPITREQAWDFFSLPANLVRISPPGMKLRIIHDGTGTNDKIFKGQIIRCKVNILPLWTAQWVSLISEVQAPDFFVDEQRSGPYALWHHMHQFQPVENGVEMVDQPKYAIPLGMLGRLAHGIFVGRELNSIFEYRYNVLNKIFRR